MDARGLRYIAKGAKAAGNAAEGVSVPARYADPLSLVGRNAEGTYRAFDLRQIENASRSSRGLDGRTVLGALDVDEFRRARYGDKKPSDVWEPEAIDEFRARADAGLNGLDVVPENLPRLKAMVDPDTGNIRINLTADWDETWETAATYADVSGSVGRRVPFELDFDAPLRGTVKNRPLSGFVEIVDDDHGGVLTTLPLNELDLPGIENIRQFVDVDLEAEAYFKKASDPEFATDNKRSRKMQPRTDAQARSMVRAMYNSDAQFLLGVKGDDALVLGTTIKGVREELARATGRNPKDVPMSEVLEHRIFDAPKKEAAEIIETQRELDDWMAMGQKDKDGNLKGGLFRHMEQRDPERYAALLKYVRETPWTRRNVYGDDVEFPDDPVLFYHYTRNFKWNDGRQYLQEGEHAEEMGRHLGSAEAANTFYGYTPIGPWPGDRRSMRKGSNSRTTVFEQASEEVGKRIDKIEADLMFLGADEATVKQVKALVLNAMEERWTSETGRYSPLGSASTLRRELDVVNGVVAGVREVLRTRGIDVGALDKALASNIHGAISTGSRITGGMMTPHVVGAKRPFRMWDYGEFDSLTVLRAISEAHFGDLETSLKVQIQDVLTGRIDTGAAERNKFAQYLLERLGFDSIIYNNTHEAGPVPSVIVWKPELIKPVTESRGFDKSDPRRAAAFMPWWAGMFGEEDGSEEAP